MKIWLRRRTTAFSQDGRTPGTLVERSPQPIVRLFDGRRVLAKSAEITPRDEEDLVLLGQLADIEANFVLFQGAYLEYFLMRQFQQSQIFQVAGRIYCASHGCSQLFAQQHEDEPVVACNIDFVSDFLRHVFPTIDCSCIVACQRGFKLYVAKKQLIVRVLNDDRELAIAFNSRPITTELSHFQLTYIPYAAPGAGSVIENVIRAHFDGKAEQLVVLDENQTELLRQIQGRLRSDYVQVRERDLRVLDGTIPGQIQFEHKIWTFIPLRIPSGTPDETALRHHLLVQAHASQEEGLEFVKLDPPLSTRAQRLISSGRYKFSVGSAVMTPTIVSRSKLRTVQLEVETQ